MIFTFDEGKKYIEEILLSENAPVLFLGAGFSYDSENKANAMDGDGLKGYIYKNMVRERIEEEDKEEVKNYNLRRLCDEVYSLDGGKEKLYSFLKTSFENTKPAPFHNNLIKYPWKDIYTVNIDDLVENIYLNNGKNLLVQNRQSLMINDGETQLFKLHGCVNNVEDGLVFSEEEYRELTTRTLDAKLNKFISDIQRENVILVGASLDEPDIHFYLQKYDDAGCKYRNNKLVIIDYKPSRYLRNMAEKLGAILVQASAEEFLCFLGELNYNPNELEKARITLSYNGVYLLDSLTKLFKKPYESKLYEGYFCQWQDVFEEWIFENESYQRACIQLDNLIKSNSNVDCFSIYGNYFSGKTCLLKALAYYLKNKGYEVLEYRGRYLNVNAITDYVRKSIHAHICLVIDNASYYYEQIEKLFSKDINEKKLVILTASRTYYHIKKMYYLEGHSFCDFKLVDELNRTNSIIVKDKLKSKKHLSYMASFSEEEKIQEIYKQKSIANLIVQLTYGGVAKRNRDNLSKSFNGLSTIEQRLLTELAIFDVADIELYPRELFSERYGKNIVLDDEISTDVMRIVDYVRMDDNELALRNSIVEKYVIEANSAILTDCIIDILKYVARYCSEKRADIWYIIFQGLLKEDVLMNKLKLRDDSIQKIYFSVKKEYEKISYYWLQLGLYMQRQGDYIAAYNYLEQSSSIRPNSYKIQHAIARNYMRHANNVSNYEEAKELFFEGERRIRKLIDSKEFYKEKAKPFSVNSFILEKVRFCRKFKVCPTDKELTYMNSIIESISLSDTYMEKVYYAFFTLLEKNHKLGILKIDLNSPYIKYIGRKNSVTENDLEYEFLVEDL